MTMATPEQDSRRAHMVVRTRLTPSQPSRFTLERPRLTQRLLEARDYRVTLIQAGAGYGKSTALAALTHAGYPLIWYHLDREDGDPLRFLLHLTHGCSAAQPGLSQTPLALLEQWDQPDRPPWSLAVDALTNALATSLTGPTLLVLDDAHYVNASAETRAILDRFLHHAPTDLHLLLSTRYPLQLNSLVSARVRGELLTLDQAELAFNAREIGDLFQGHYNLTLQPGEAERVARAVEGWPIALPLIRQRLHGGATLPQALTQLAQASGDLFTYLAQEVLAQLPAATRDFLRATAVLRQLTPELCDRLRQADDSREILAHLQANALFVVPVGEHLRYHHLFRDLLQQQLSPAEAQAAQRAAAIACQALGDEEEAIGHYLAAGEVEAAAPLLERQGRRLIQAGRLEPLGSWISSLPPELLAQHPVLLIYLGDIARLHSRFETALGWYQQAEAYCRATRDWPGLGQALRGQARVYLDTVNPSQAEQLLQEALRLSDGEEDRVSRARLLELLAENLLNQGRLPEAEQFRQQARALRQAGPGEAELPYRLLLRTGRINEARTLLEEQAALETHAPVLRPRAHRETLLLLALILAFQGEQAAAQRCALAGTQRGQTLDSPFVTAVGLMRQGHAWLLRKDEAGYDEAERCFEQAIALSQTLETPRLRVEAQWGLTQVYGFRGQLERARDSAESGLWLAQQAGDEWVAACIRTSLGASYVLAGLHDAAADWLAQAHTSFRDCSDTHGLALTLMWQSLLWQARHDEARLTRDLEALLRLVREHDYAWLFRRPTLMGPPDPRALIPLLLFARRHVSLAAYAHNLLEQLGLGQLELHPGYQLRVQTLGSFRLWLGAQEAPAKIWRRQKARQLFQLFLTYRRTLLHREQILEILWPELGLEDATRDFKIAYNALCQALEPERERNAPSAYIARDGSRYGLRPEADIWFDAAVFDEWISQADRLLHGEPAAARERYRQALALYAGDYLQEFPYEEWASQERKRLLNRYLRSAERLARSLAHDRLWDEAIEVCQALLHHDNGWEPAYQILISAYAAQGNRSAALRAYQRCVDALQTELGVAPTAATTELYSALLVG